MAKNIVKNHYFKKNKIAKV